MAKPTREEMIAKLRGKAGGMARPSYGGDRFKPEDGRYSIRILPGYDYKVCDGGPSFELFQHWFKIDGKTRPFFCGARTMMEEHDSTKCRLCQTWELLGQMEEAAADASKDLKAIIEMTRKKFTFRSSSVMNIVVRGKKDAPDKAMVWGCPPSVAQSILNTIADNMDDDEDFDPFDADNGWDWTLTRVTEKNNTSYTIALKTKPSPLGEYEGEIADLDKMYENELKQSTNERNTTAIEELITNMLDPIFELADDEGIDLSSFRDGKTKGKAKPKAETAKPKDKPKPSADDDDDDAPPPPKVKSEMKSKPIERELPDKDDDDDADPSELDSARQAIAEANAMFDPDDDDD